MYNPKDTQFAGKHDFDKEEAVKYANNINCKTFSVGVFQWEMKNQQNAMKKGKIKVRISGSTGAVNSVFDFAENVVKDLDNNLWDGRKTVVVK